MRFTPSAPFSCAMRLLIPITTNVKGVVKKTYSEPSESPLIFGSFRTFGGSDTTENDLYTVLATGYIDTWYRPDIRSDCRVYIIQTGETYEIMGEPENISMRNQYMKIRVQKIGGAA